MNRVQSARKQERAEKSRAGAGFSATSQSSGFQIEPHYAIVISLLYVGIVIVLHMIGKYRKDAAPVVV